MEKIKIIDLLNKIANEEEIPQIVSYEGKKYHIDELEHFYVSDNRKALLEYIFDYLNDFDALMTEVEIIEKDKKIEKYKYQYSQIPPWFRDKELISAINENFEKHTKAIYEILDYINKEKENE